MSGEKSAKVSELWPGIREKWEFDNWLEKIDEGSRFACQRRGSFPLGTVFMDVFIKVGQVGKCTWLHRLIGGELIPECVITKAFSQMYQLEEDDV
jgi:hypothetical protein